ncbi:hypothetical protein Poly30_46270 [Planctomycetes bacterium Poly30]|uniref:LamG-like jellyroll fold domain-containing protein n=1 Tax=Saltatorellus ferox TaxID=2528018 RepID=A0A518EYA5_9BACT|nr:hypothetical protein Poly30_46270 [Planctomycetes bacterium Poly30]
MHFTFDGMDVTNVASPGYAAAATNQGMIFTPSTGCGRGFAAESVGSSLLIETNYAVDFGTSSWTIGMIVDLETGGNGFQYFFGANSASTMRCFCNGASGQDNIMLRSPGGDIVIDGATTLGTPHQIVFVYDSVAQEIRGYLDGVLTETMPQSSALDLNGTAADFQVGGHLGGTMLTGSTIDEFRVYRRAVDQSEITSWAACTGGSGMNYCTPAVNSTGVAASIFGTGSTVVTNNSFELGARDMPVFSFAFFITSQTQGFAMNPGGSAGNLCVTGSVGRYVGPGQIQQSNLAGEISLAIDLTATPQPNGFVSVQPGETWNFQVWYRDSAGGVPTSNFSDGLQVDFL